MMQNIADIRKEYKKETLDESMVALDPMQQFDIWWNEALISNIDEVNAMTLATADRDGKPSARIVLLKGYTPDGFVFFTNYESKKGQQLSQNHFAALVFFWKELERQVRITGEVIKINDYESDDYFNSRPEESKLGAWASPQSKVIDGRKEIENNFKEERERFNGKVINRPPHWGGYKLIPSSIEFWQGRPNRLHDRISYTKDGNDWNIERLAP